MALPLFLRKLTAPREVKLVLLALNEERRQINNQFATSSGFDTAMPRVTHDVLRWSKQIQADLSPSKTPRAIALWLTANVSRDYLASGSFHIYRGSLSMQGDGLKAAVTYCLSELVKLGQMTPEDRQAALAATTEDIKQVG